MPENEWRGYEDNQVHDHIPALGRKVQRGRIDTSGPRINQNPLGLEGDATDHPNNEESEVSGRQNGDDAVAEAFFPAQNGDAHVLKHNGQLQEVVRPGIELSSTDQNL